jgi:YggT family protein
MGFAILLISYAVNLLTIVIIVDIFLSYFMDPYQPIRRALDAVVNPLLNPIRRIVPPVSMIDFSPLILLIIVQVLGNVLINLLRGV